MNYYIELCPDATKEQQFFVFVDGSPLCAHQLHNTLKSMIKGMGLDPALYSFHGLRTGRASQMLNMGVSVETIKKLGQWKSNAVFTYLRD